MKDERILSCSDIEAGYYKKRVLNGISIEIHKGEIVSLIGPNGAGKSTLLKVIFGLLKPTKGKVIFEGRNITGRAPYKNSKDGIGYFIQGGEVFTNLTVIENLSLIQAISDRKSDFRIRIDEIFALFPEIEKFKNKRAGLLSGGERQMLALGILLVKQPRLLLLDEPLSKLSSGLMERFSTKIKEINSNLGISIVLVEQNIPKALSIAKRVYLMKLGEIVLSDTPQNILKNNKLEEIYFK